MTMRWRLDNFSTSSFELLQLEDVTGQDLRGFCRYGEIPVHIASRRVWLMTVGTFPVQRSPRRRRGILRAQLQGRCPR